jgi:hypothetical protein
MQSIRARGGRGWDAALLALVLPGLLTGCRATFWSPDGKRIAVTAYSGIHLFGVEKGTFRTLVPGESEQREALAPAWSPDGKRICYVRAMPDETVTVETVEVASGGRTVVSRSPVSWDDRESCGVVWSPHARDIAFCGTERLPDGSEPSAIWIVGAGGGAPHRLVPQGQSVGGPAWSPDGRRIAYLAFTGPGDSGAASLQLAGVDGREQRRLWQVKEGWEFQSVPQWSGDGTRLGVLVGRSETEEGQEKACEAWLISARDGSGRKLAEVPGEGAYASFLPALDSIFFVNRPEKGDAARIQSAALLTPPFRQPRVLVREESRYQSDLAAPALSPDGKTVAAVHLPGEGPATLLLRYTDGRPGRAYEVPR